MRLSHDCHMTITQMAKENWSTITRDCHVYLVFYLFCEGCDLEGSGEVRQKARGKDKQDNGGDE